MPVVLDTSLPNLGLDRSYFYDPFEVFAFGEYIYKNTKLTDIVIYDKVGRCYFYEDERVQICDPSGPVDLGLIFFTIKPILFSQSEEASFYLNNCLNENTLLDTFTCFKMVIHATQEKFSGILITPEHYRVILNNQKTDINRYMLAQQHIHPDFFPDKEKYKEQRKRGVFLTEIMSTYNDLVVDEISIKSVNEIFHYLLTKYKENSHWLKRCFGIGV